MAADKFLYNNGGIVTEKAGAVTAVANAIPALDASGRLVTAQMPVGVGAQTVDIPTSESLAAGDFVNLWNDAGTVKARKADASAGKPSQGFVLSVFSHPATALVYVNGGGKSNNQKTGMTPGARQYLSAAAPGGTVETAPTTAGYLVEFLGTAISATEMVTVDGDYIVLA